VNVYRSDPHLRRILRTAVESLRPDGCYLPLSDTRVDSRPDLRIFEIGLRRCPELFRGAHRRVRGERSPTDYAVFHLESETLAGAPPPALPERWFPHWMTGVLRHGSGPEGTVLAMPDNPPGVHRHADNLAVYYFDRGRAILGDLGYVCDTPMNAWIKSTFSHNLVIVDDEEQSAHERQPRLNFYVKRTCASAVEAASNCYSQCTDYRRLLALIKGPGASTFAVDIFRVAGGQKHVYRLFSELADSTGGELVFDGLSMPAEGTIPNFGGSTSREHIFGLRDPRTCDDPGDAWQATWRESQECYRLRFFSPTDAVRASHGPGQEKVSQAGRRVRYVDAVRKGEELRSTFVALHEPCQPDGAMPLRSATRLELPDVAGPDAVALHIRSQWGDYLVLSQFQKEAEVAGLRFRGCLGIFCGRPEQCEVLLKVDADDLRNARKGEPQ
jgi:hypothetical protein